jgi:hypothetical protein
VRLAVSRNALSLGPCRQWWRSGGRPEARRRCTDMLISDAIAASGRARLPAAQALWCVTWHRDQAPRRLTRPGIPMVVPRLEGASWR